MTALLCAAAFLLGANAFDKEFQAANAAYEGGQFAEAAQGYERMIASGAVNAEVFYNLGNAYYKAGRLGPAIANYERAIALKPGFETARDNLQMAVGETKNKLPKPLRPGWEQAMLFWDVNLPYAAVRALALVWWLAFWGVLVAGLFRKMPYGRSFAVLLLCLAALSGLSAWCKAHPLQLAVGAMTAAPKAASGFVTFSTEVETQTTDTAPVRYGNSDSDEVRFELSEGDRVAVEDRADGWVRVRSVDGVRGWVRESQVCLVGPPYSAAPTAPEPDKKS